MSIINYIKQYDDKIEIRYTSSYILCFGNQIEYKKIFNVYLKVLRDGLEYEKFLNFMKKIEYNVAVSYKTSDEIINHINYGISEKDQETINIYVDLEQIKNLMLQSAYSIKIIFTIGKSNMAKFKMLFV